METDREMTREELDKIIDLDTIQKELRIVRDDLAKSLGSIDEMLKGAIGILPERMSIFLSEPSKRVLMEIINEELVRIDKEIEEL